MKRSLLFFSSLAVFSAAANPGLTIYNQNIAVVRETIPLDLAAGITKVSFDGATSQVRPDSVVLRDPTGTVDFQILEQSYRNDPISQTLLLSLFEGKTIDFHSTKQDGSTEIIAGEVIRSGYGLGRSQSSPIIQVDGNIQFELPGVPHFPALGSDSILKPTLNWQIGNDSAAQLDAQLSYMSHGFTWEATYNIVVPEEDGISSMEGLVTIANSSGTDFVDASIKLVAGEVSVAQPVSGFSRASYAAEAHSDALMEQKSFGDYHLYTLPRKVTLRNQETKQVGFLSTDKLKAKKVYEYSSGFFGVNTSINFNPSQDSQFSKKVSAGWEFENTVENGLDAPLPEGIIRFYRSDDTDGNLEFVGESRTTHTPKNETVSVTTGFAFDLVGEKTVTNFQSTRSPAGAHRPGNSIRESIEITLTNRSESVKSIKVTENLWRYTNWEIENPSTAFTKKNANTIEFNVDVPADEKVTLSFTAYYFN